MFTRTDAMKDGQNSCEGTVDLLLSEAAALGYDLQTDRVRRDGDDVRRLEAARAVLIRLACQVAPAVLQESAATVGGRTVEVRQPSKSRKLLVPASVWQRLAG